MSEAQIPPSNLGSLAQTARRKHLRQARVALIAVGILTILVNAVMFLMAERMVDAEIQKELRNAGPGAAVDQAEVNNIRTTYVRAQQLVAGGTVLLGVVFIVLGVVVDRYPVGATATGLALYIGAVVIFAVLEGDPAAIGRGIIIKVIIIVALVKALQAGIAYQKEQQQAGMTALPGNVP